MITTNENTLAFCELGIARWNALVKQARVASASDNHTISQQVFEMLKQAYFEVSEFQVQHWCKNFTKWASKHRSEYINPSDFKIHAYLGILEEEREGGQKVEKFYLALIDMFSDQRSSFEPKEIILSAANKQWTYHPDMADRTSNNTTLNPLDAVERIVAWDRLGVHWWESALNNSTDQVFRAFDIPFLDFVDLSDKLGSYYVFLGLREEKTTSLDLTPAKYTISPEIIVGRGEVNQGIHRLEYVTCEEGVSTADLSTLVPPFKPGADSYQLYEQSVAI